MDATGYPRDVFPPNPDQRLRQASCVTRSLLGTRVESGREKGPELSSRLRRSPIRFRGTFCYVQDACPLCCKRVVYRAAKIKFLKIGF